MNNMVTKQTERIMPKHNSTHKEYYEPKLEMICCGCGNRRNLTEQERLAHGLIVYSDKTDSFLEVIIKISDIPEKRNRWNK